MTSGLVVHEFARGNGYRLVEHYDDQWRAQPNYNPDQPRDCSRGSGDMSKTDTCGRDERLVVRTAEGVV